MNHLLPTVFLFAVLGLTTGCADSVSGPIIKMSYALDFADAQRFANVECKKLNTRSARMVNGEPDYTFECVEFGSAADGIPVVEVPILRHGPLD
jgi:hypothetical protein